MVNVNNDSLVRDIEAFSGLIKLVQYKAKLFEFSAYLTANAIATQDSIQGASYIFAEFCFKTGNQSENGRKIQNYLANLDLLGIGLGMIDLSAPYLNSQKMPSDEILDRIIWENNCILQTLKDPLPVLIEDEKFSTLIQEFYANLKQDDVDKEALVDSFFTEHSEYFSCVRDLSKILSVLCISQSLYIYAYLLKTHPVLSEVFELLMTVKHPKFDNTVLCSLATQYSHVFIGNLSLRVFGKENKDLLSEVCDLSEIA